MGHGGRGVIRAGEQGSANIFCKGPDDKYFPLCRPNIGCTSIQLCHSHGKAGLTHRCVSMAVFPIKLYLWTLTLEFGFIFTHHGILFFGLF